jgi:hypothetical protein
MQSSWIGRIQECFEKCIGLVPNGDLVVKVKRFVRTSILNRRYLSKAGVKGGISFSEYNKLLTSWVGLPILSSKIFLVSNLGH